MFQLFQMLIPLENKTNVPHYDLITCHPYKTPPARHIKEALDNSQPVSSRFVSATTPGLTCPHARSLCPTVNPSTA